MNGAVLKIRIRFGSSTLVCVRGVLCNGIRLHVHVYSLFEGNIMYEPCTT